MVFLHLIKVVAAVVVIIRIVFWVINSVLPQSYNGTDLNFAVKGGTVVVTNPSDASIPVQFSDTGTRNFRVSSDIEDVSGSSTRDGNGNSAIQSFDIELPAGTSEFTISRGTNVTFVASTPVELDVTVNSMLPDASRNTIIAAIVAIIGILFYASRVMDHSWIHMLTNKKPIPQDTKPDPNPVLPTAQGRAARSFGDNRTEAGD